MSNLGLIDRLLRAAVGIGLIVWAMRGGPLWAWIGVLPLATALFAVCPAYLLFGWNTGAK